VLSSIRSHLPRWLGLRTQLRRLFRVDIRSKVPFEHDQFVGAGDFVQNGEVWFQIFRQHVQLVPEDVILDVGSGQGRMARPLVGFLSRNTGEYHGLEIVKAGVDFCHKAYRDQPNFQFHHIPIYNQHYNPSGSTKASEYTFPFPDAHFSLVILTSVFTHMLQPDLERYCAEIYRVLKPGGRALVTFFLLDRLSRKSIEGGQVRPLLRHKVSQVCCVETPNDLEDAVGYDSEYIIDLVTSCGFAEPEIHLGSWGRSGKRLSYQDVLILRRACDRSPSS